MASRNLRARKPGQSTIEMAIAALDGSVHPLDLDVRDLDPSPTGLDLPAAQEAATGPHHRRSARTSVDECIVCGQPVSEE
jgi:hypothetical protein